MMTTATITSGRIILLFGNILYAGGAFLADWNVTHIYNPNWPPHARFHNGQTMSLGVCLAAASIYFTFRPSLPNNTIAPKESVFAAAMIGSFYCFAGCTAILYPGTDWHDPEYPNQRAQMFLFPGIVAMMWVGYLLEVRRIGIGSAKGKVS